MSKNKLLLKRLIASIIDFILIGIVTLIVFFFTRNAAYYIASFLVLTLIYYTAFIASPLQSSPGMNIFGIWVNFKNNKKIFLKSLLRMLTALISFIPFGIGYWYGFFDQNGNTVYDILSKSEVVCNKEEKKNNLIPCVFYITPDKSTKCYKIPKGGLTIGRDPNHCRILFPKETPGISRNHCSVTYNEQTGMFLIEDLCSSYGTFLKNGDQIYPGKIAAIKQNEKFYAAEKHNMFCVGFKEC